MNAGKLNRRIQIQSQSTTQDDFGQPLQTWVTVYRAWAAIDIQNSALIYSTAEFMSKVVTRITIRWTSSVIINASNRIVYIEPTTNVVHTYQVEAPVNTKQGNKELVILCYELDSSE